MRNTGWYIPYWRKIKKKGKQEKPTNEAVSRSDDQLESVRRRWIERYRRTVRSLRLMGLSVGSNRGEVQARYTHLREAGAARPYELEDAYRYLMRVLPPSERRKRRPRPGAPSEPGAAMAESPLSATVTVDVYTETVELDIDRDLAAGATGVEDEDNVYTEQDEAGEDDEEDAAGDDDDDELPAPPDDGGMESDP